MKIIVHLKNILFVGSIACLLVSCATISGQETVGEYMSDTAITSKVKTEILRDPLLTSSQIHVESLKGTVQLRGFVSHQAQKEKAGEIARTIKGVSSVDNALVVKK